MHIAILYQRVNSGQYGVVCITGSYIYTNEGTCILGCSKATIAKREGYCGQQSRSGESIKYLKHIIQQ